MACFVVVINRIACSLIVAHFRCKGWHRRNCRFVSSGKSKTGRREVGARRTIWLMGVPVTLAATSVSYSRGLSPELRKLLSFRGWNSLYGNCVRPQREGNSGGALDYAPFGALRMDTKT